MSKKSSEALVTFTVNDASYIYPFPDLTHVEVEPCGVPSTGKRSVMDTVKDMFPIYSTRKPVFTLPTAEWTTAFEHSEMVIVLMADSKGNALYPITDIMKDHYVLHTVRKNPLSDGDILTIDKVGYVCLKYWAHGKGHTTAYGYTLDTLFLGAFTDKGLRKGLTQINNKILRGDYPGEGNDSVTILVNKNTIDTAKLDVQSIAGEVLTKASLIWLVHE